MSYSLFFAIWGVVVGACVGSFVDVLANRLNNELSPISGRSICPKCKKRLIWRDNIPIISFLVLKGRCRSCRKKISWRYPLVELVFGLIFGVGAWGMSDIIISGGSINSVWQAVYLLSILSILGVVLISDLRYMIIPDEMIAIGCLLAFFYNFLFFENWIGFLQAGFLACLLLLSLWLATKGQGMGFGDVKFAFFMGLVLGVRGVVVALYMAFLTGGVAGTVLLLTGNVRLKQRVAFGPFLIIGTIIAYFWSERILGLIGW